MSAKSHNDAILARLLGVEAQHDPAADADPMNPNATRWVSCETCGGSGEMIYGEAPEQSNELCGACGGTGRDCVEVSPVECDDDQPHN